MSTDMTVASSGQVSVRSPSANGASFGVSCRFLSTQADFPSARRPRHSPAAHPVVSPSGRRWVRMMKLSCSRSICAVSSLVIACLSRFFLLLRLELRQKIEHVRAVFERVVQLEHQLWRIAQLQAAAELAPEPAARGFEPAQGVFLLFLVEDADINFAVAQIRRGVDAGDGNAASARAGP